MTYWPLIPLSCTVYAGLSDSVTIDLFSSTIHESQCHACLVFTWHRRLLNSGNRGNGFNELAPELMGAQCGAQTLQAKNNRLKLISEKLITNYKVRKRTTQRVILIWLNTVLTAWHKSTPDPTGKAYSVTQTHNWILGGQLLGEGDKRG